MFRAREISNVEKAMIEAGIDVRSSIGVGKYALSKVIEIGPADKLVDIVFREEWLSSTSVGEGIVAKEKEGIYLRVVEFNVFESRDEWFVAVWDFEKEDWVRYVYDYKSNTEKIVDWNYRYV